MPNEDQVLIEYLISLVDDKEQALPHIAAYEAARRQRDGQQTAFYVTLYLKLRRLILNRGTAATDSKSITTEKGLKQSIASHVKIDGLSDAIQVFFLPPAKKLFALCNMAFNAIFEIILQSWSEEKLLAGVVKTQTTENTILGLTVFDPAQKRFDQKKLEEKNLTEDKVIYAFKKLRGNLQDTVETNTMVETVTKQISAVFPNAINHIGSPPKNQDFIEYLARLSGRLTEEISYIADEEETAKTAAEKLIEEVYGLEGLAGIKTGRLIHSVGVERIRKTIIENTSSTLLNGTAINASGQLDFSAAEKRFLKLPPAWLKLVVKALHVLVEELDKLKAS